ncbi:c-type cytochrome [Anabaenopsis tanganyikae CS-531]|uniref:C-type cytochrome n=2 Tax=Anabaenopsis TaxID=110103 RepID=A0ABT6KK58_9CYAN|nr:MULTISPECIES: c-type cytochrome [Anabaenopsis]MDB9539881.1 c-type cytochrome [Anabaenopsis arnoldii]MDH6092185.1 c-type cytochrome [Anabaenopsis arnoldii]MDH6107616.1 c-type cytochrome [Anabaenopsis tanganyikae CS-531]
MHRLLILPITTIFLFINTLTFPVMAADINHGAEIFSIHCAGCHINGGNIIRRGKNLKKPALEKYGMNTIEAVTSIVTNGKNNMSAYQDRLTPEEIQAVGYYVLQQAETGWR